jgi:hypothetical protein
MVIAPMQSKHLVVAGSKGGSLQLEQSAIGYSGDRLTKERPHLGDCRGTRAADRVRRRNRKVADVDLTSQCHNPGSPNGIRTRAATLRGSPSTTSSGRCGTAADNESWSPLARLLGHTPLDSPGPQQPRDGRAMTRGSGLKRLKGPMARDHAEGLVPAVRAGAIGGPGARGGVSESSN